MRARSIKMHLFILTLGISSAILALMIMVLIPTINHIRRLSADIRAEREQIDNDRLRHNSPERSLQELPDVITQVQKFKESASQPGRELELIKLFERLAEENHLTETFRIDASPERYLFATTIQGAFADQLQFFHALEELNAYVIIESIEWTKQAQTPNDKTLTTRFTAKIYAAVP